MIASTNNIFGGSKKRGLDNSILSTAMTYLKYSENAYSFSSLYDDDEDINYIYII